MHRDPKGWLSSSAHMRQSAALDYNDLILDSQNRALETLLRLLLADALDRRNDVGVHGLAVLALWIAHRHSSRHHHRAAAQPDFNNSHAPLGMAPVRCHNGVCLTCCSRTAVVSIAQPKTRNARSRAALLILARALHPGEDLAARGDIAVQRYRCEAGTTMNYTASLGPAHC